MIRSLTRDDYDVWLPLWNANCLNQMTNNVTAETWRRITNQNENVFALGAFDGDTLTGILHYILHPTTGYIEPACYMQDVYVAEEHRRKGIAKQLISHLNNIGQNQKWARIYWFAENDNAAVKNLYKSLGIRMDFSLHILPTQQ